MLWQARRESDNVEDAGRSGGGRIAVGGGIGGVILVVAYLLLGGEAQRVTHVCGRALRASWREKSTR
jgi:predicted metalloprotease